MDVVVAVTGVLGSSGRTSRGPPARRATPSRWALAYAGLTQYFAYSPLQTSFFFRKPLVKSFLKFTLLIVSGAIRIAFSGPRPFVLTTSCT